MGQVAFRLVLGFVLIFALVPSQILVDGRKAIKKITNTMEYCYAEDLYKPYLKYYYGGRLKALKNGRPDSEHGPGQHYDFLTKPNTYVCINGLAWMYYAKIQAAGLPVLVTPELHIYEHTCMLTNYLTGPGRTTPWPNETIPIPMLYSILLMGDKEDYRKPSIELITAPTAEIVWNAEAKAMEVKSPLRYVNGTSLVMIGDDTECILQKGRSPMRVRSGQLTITDHRPSPDASTPEKVEELENYAGSFCKFSYGTLLEPIAESNLADIDSKEAKEADVIFAAEGLLSHGDLTKKGCFVPDDYTKSTLDIITAREASLQAKGNATANPKTVLQESKDVFDKVYGWSANSTAGAPNATAKADQPVVKNGALLYKDLPELVKVEATDPCLEKQDKVEEICVALATKPCPNVTLETVEECSPTADPKCDPCNSTNPAVQNHTRILLKNIAEYNKETPPNDKAKDDIKALALSRLKPCLRNLWKLTSKLGIGGSAASGLYKETLDAWANGTEGGMKAVDEYVTAAHPPENGTAPGPGPAPAPTEDSKAIIFAKKQLAAAAISRGESLRSNLEALISLTERGYKEFVRNVEIVAGGGVPSCVEKPEDSPPITGVITIKRDKAATDYIKPFAKGGSKDPTAYPPDTSKTCATLPAVPVSCKNSKPEEVRACQLLNARMNNYEIPGPPPTQQDWEGGDMWREEIMSLIADIFTKSCEPMVKPSFAKEVNHVIKGYLIDYVKGTLKKIQVSVQKDPNCTAAAGDPTGTPPVPATVCESDVEECDFEVHGALTPRPVEMGDGNGTECPIAALPVRRNYWDQLRHALSDCKAHERVLRFKRKYRDGNKDKPYDTFIYELMGKPFKEWEIAHNIEQADIEYDFNYAIDSFWRMFATTMALCMPYIEKPMPDVTRQYYAIFTEDFLYPLAKEWRNNRDNPVFELILGAYYGKKTDYWAKLCMESAFRRTGDVRWRPPRKLLVNGLSEMNYFNEGPIYDLSLSKNIYGGHFDVGRFS